MAVEASDGDSTWKETIKAKMAEFKGMTPEERKAQKEEATAAMIELKESEAWQNADKEEQMKMMKELGVFPLRGFGRAFGSAGFKESESFSGNHQAVQAVKDAIEAGDYEAWLEATEGRKFAGKITEEDFLQIVEAHNLMQAGDKEGAKEIMKELGIKRSPKAMHSFGKGFKKGFLKGIKECEEAEAGKDEGSEE